jgi:uncharacterized protein
MKFMIYTVDIEGGLPIRTANRAAHLAFLKAASDVKVLAAGPWLNAEGGDMSGSLLIVEAPSEDAARLWLDQDPYYKAGLRADLILRPFIWALGAPE